MGRRRFRIRVLVRIALLAAAVAMVSADLPAASSDAGATHRYRYRMTLGGTEMARLDLTIRGEGEDRRLALDMINTGISAWFARIRTEMRSTVAAVDGAALPVAFTALYEKPDRRREIRLEYDAEGRLASVRLVKNGRPKRSDVPPELQAGTIDPLTAFVRLQDWLRAPREEGDRILLGVFEGRKRLDLEAVYVAPATVPYRGREVPGHRLRVRLTGLFGFDDGFGFVGRPDQEPVWLDVLTTDGDSPILIRAVGRSRSLEPVVELD